MLPTQILLNNLLYDLSEIGIPFDGVRAEATALPQVRDMRSLMRFAGIMGPLCRGPLPCIGGTVKAFGRKDLYFPLSPMNRAAHRR